MPEAPMVYDQHDWEGACYVPLNDRQAKYAERRGAIRLDEQTRIDVLEVICGRCRRPFDEVKDQKCVRTRWLHGGPVGERAGRGGEDEEEMDVEDITADALDLRRA